MRPKLQKTFDALNWGGRRGQFPRSGPGSTLERTANLRAALPDLFRRYNVQRFLDAPCGDWFWMQHVDLTGIDYIGADIAPSIIAENVKQFSSANVSFRTLDITSDPLPKADMLMCRDCLFHLKWFLRWDFFRNFIKSEIPYLMTTICHVQSNTRLRHNGRYKAFNPMKPPFNFSEPLDEILESEAYVPTGEDDAFADLSMGVWSRDQVVQAVSAYEASETVN